MKNLSHARFANTFAALALAALTPIALAEPVIERLGEDDLPRSGRIVIHGAGFGAQGIGSYVEVDGARALNATWTHTRIVAFVPESADIGPATVRVVASGETSNEAEINVHARSRDGRVLWTFEADSNNLWYRPALAPDGTVYVHGSGGFVYALAPDGGLKWITRVNAYPYVAPMAGPDGVVYVSSIQTIYAISAEGELLWQFQDLTAQGLQVALTPGSDGNLYGAFDAGLGAVSLNTAGNLLWNNPGNPAMFEYGGGAAEMRFGPSCLGDGPADQLYIGMDRSGDNRIYAFALDGSQRWAVPVGPNGRGAVPAVGSDGMVYAADFIARGTGWNIQALDPHDGSRIWLYDGDFISGMSRLEIGPDDTLYYVRDLGHLEALDTSGPSILWRNSTGNVLDQPGLSPDGSALLLGGTPDYGRNGFIRAYDAADGRQLWQIDLPGNDFPGLRWLVTENPRFSHDGAVAYFTTVALGDDDTDPHTFVYAVAMGLCPADLDGDGDADADDFFAYLDLFAAGDTDADLDGDGDNDADDYFAYLDAFVTGC